MKDINLFFLFLFLSPSLPLNLLTSPLNLGNIKTNCLITSSKYLVKYLELFFVSINFEISILSTSASQIFIFSYTIKVFFATFASPNLNIIILSKNDVDFIFQLIDTNIFLKMFYSNTRCHFYYKLT